MQKAYRLQHRASFSYIYRKGEKLFGRYMMIYYVPAYNTKLGVSISKKVGKAVFRNLTKRRINEVFSRLVPIFKGSYNYVIVVSPNVKEATFQDLAREMERLFLRQGVIDKQTLESQKKMIEARERGLKVRDLPKDDKKIETREMGIKGQDLSNDDGEKGKE